MVSYSSLRNQWSVDKDNPELTSDALVASLLHQASNQSKRANLTTRSHQTIQSNQGRLGHRRKTAVHLGQVLPERKETPGESLIQLWKRPGPPPGLQGGVTRGSTSATRLMMISHQLALLIYSFRPSRQTRIRMQAMACAS